MRECVMYERLAKVLDLDDESYAAAREVLKALRDPSSEVLAAGIPDDRWRAAIDAMVASADRADRHRAEAEAEERAKRWPAIRHELEELGCQVRRSNGAATLWEIEAPGVGVRIDLSTGQIEGLDLWGMGDSTTSLADLIAKELRDRRVHLAHEDRKKQLRLTHTWVNKKKAWVPNSGEGPVIPGGGSAS